MKYSFFVLGLVGLSSFANRASADEGPAPQPAPQQEKHESTVEEEHEHEDDGGVPKARSGFQMSLRPGIAIPMGSADKTTDQSDLFGGQFLTTLDIGAKAGTHAFIGGYLGLGFGGAGGKLADSCDKSNLSCKNVSVHLGAEFMWSFIPDGLVNPWAGYGIGFEVSTLSVSGSGLTGDASVTYSGFEFAHFLGGVDFRVSRVFGIGPFIDLSLAQYSVGKISGLGSADRSGSLDDKAIHEWFVIGAKGTFFP